MPLAHPSPTMTMEVYPHLMRERRCEVNPLHGEIAFGRVVINQNGAQLYAEYGSKTDDHRIVPVPALVMEELERHIATYCPDAGPRDFLFLTRNGTHRDRHRR